MAINVNWRESKQAHYVDINHLGKRAGIPFSVREYGTKAKAGTAADAFAAKARAQLKAGKFKLDDKAARITVRQLAEETLTLQGDNKDSTMDLKRSVLTNHLYPAPLADMLISSVTRNDIKVFAGGLSGLKYSSKLTVLRVVATVFSSAVERHLITHNPAAKQKKAVRITNDERLAKIEKVRVLTAGQVADLLDGIAAIHGAGSVYHTLFLLLARTGLRISEAFALQWDCIDFAARTLTVKRNISRRALSTPKTHQVRTVDLTSQLTTALHALYVHADDADFVFPNHDDPNDFLKYRTVLQAAWDPSADHMGLGRLTPHVLRHTVASQLLAARRSLLFVSKLLGHKDAEFTLKVYGHLVPDDESNTVEILDTVPVAEPQTKPQPRRNLAHFPVPTESRKPVAQKALRAARLR